MPYFNFRQPEQWSMNNRKSGSASGATAQGFDPLGRALEVQIDVGCYCGKTNPSNVGQRREQ